MIKRGRPPLPTAIKKIMGNPGRRPLNEHEPQPDPVIPDPPEWLCDDARSHWDDVAPQLSRMGVLTRIDRDALAAYCDTYSRWKRAVKFLGKNGDVFPIKNPDGTVKYVQQWPQVAIARNLLTAMVRYQQEFGMTPSGRSQLTVEPSHTPPIDDFLKPPPSRKPESWKIHAGANE